MSNTLVLFFFFDVSIPQKVFQIKSIQKKKKELIRETQMQIKKK